MSTTARAYLEIKTKEACMHCVFVNMHVTACLLARMYQCGHVPASPSACHLASSPAVAEDVGCLMPCIPVSWLSRSPAGWRSLSSRSSWAVLQRSTPGTAGSAQATRWTRTPGCWRPTTPGKQRQKQQHWQNIMMKRWKLSYRCIRGEDNRETWRREKKGKKESRCKSPCGRREKKESGTVEYEEIRLQRNRRESRQMGHSR